MLSLFSLRPLPRVLGRRLQSSGSFFHEISQSPPSNPSSSAPATDAEAATYVTNKDLRRHPEIEAKLNPAPGAGRLGALSVRPELPNQGLLEEELHVASSLPKNGPQRRDYAVPLFRP